MTINDIAQQITSEYDLPLHELKRKQYCGNPHLSMKVDFVKQCRDAGFSNIEIADYMDYRKSSVSELYGIAVAGEPRFKWQKVLHALKQGQAVSEDDFSHVSSHIPRIREEGYYPYRTPEGEYRL